MLSVRQLLPAAKTLAPPCDCNCERANLPATTEWDDYQCSTDLLFEKADRISSKGMAGPKANSQLNMSEFMNTIVRVAWWRASRRAMP